MNHAVPRLIAAYNAAKSHEVSESEIADALVDEIENVRQELTKYSLLSYTHKMYTAIDDSPVIPTRLVHIMDTVRITDLIHGAIGILDPSNTEPIMKKIFQAAMCLEAAIKRTLRFAYLYPDFIPRVHQALVVLSPDYTDKEWETVVYILNQSTNSARSIDVSDFK